MHLLAQVVADVPVGVLEETDEILELAENRDILPRASVLCLIAPSVKREVEMKTPRAASREKTRTQCGAI